MSRTQNDLTGMTRNAFIHAAKQGELAGDIDAESAGDVFDAWLNDIRSTSIHAEAEDIDMGSRAAKAYIARDLDGEPLDIDAVIAAAFKGVEEYRRRPVPSPRSLGRVGDTPAEPHTGLS